MSNTVELAARRLDERLRRCPWYLSIGAGAAAEGKAIFIYVKSSRHCELSRLARGWMGFPVFVRGVGAIRAAKTVRAIAC
jgi:hypothetical protein